MSTHPQDPHMSQPAPSPQPPAPHGQVPGGPAYPSAGEPGTGPGPYYPPVRTVIEPMGRLTFGRSLTSELLKLWTAPGVRWASVITLVIHILFTLAIYRSSVDFSDDITTEAVVSFFFFPIVLTTAIGIAHMTNEYAHTSIRVSLQAVPRRLMFYTTKLLSIALYALIIPLLTLAISFAIAELTFSSTSDLYNQLTPYLNYVLIILFTAVASCALGTMFRNTAAAITIVFTAVFVLQILGAMMVRFIGDIEQYMPFNLIMRAIMPEGSWFGPVEPTTALLIYLGYCLAVIILGAVAIRTRDA
ncbi:MAG: hypothetical protein Q4P33_04315 [Flaviflexus sp.]|nr:hypothetical protein [Flaviflexus sp.]